MSKKGMKSLYLKSGEHRLPLNHNCSQWNRVDKQLIQCVTCSNLIKAPEQPNLSPKEAVKNNFRQ